MKIKTENLIKEYNIQFNLFYNELIEYNNKFNLTTITDKKEVEVKHFLDSLSSINLIKSLIKENKKNIENKAGTDGTIDNKCLTTIKGHYAPTLKGASCPKAGTDGTINKQSLTTLKEASCLDVGVGAGFPSVPLAIVLKDINFTLVETIGKKVSFLNNIKEKLQLKNIDIKKTRIEDLDKSFKFDFCVSRAVASLSTLLEYTLPFVKKDGFVICYKSANYLQELELSKNALEILGGTLEKIENYKLELNDEVMDRYLVVIKKTSETPDKYPRNGNKPRLKAL